MEPIIKLTIETDLGFRTRHRYFHSVKQAKRWCENSVGHPIYWQRDGDLNSWRSPEIDTYSQRRATTFFLEPVTIEVMDDNDGEV